MILLVAIVAGLLLGLARSKLNGVRYQPSSLAHTWLVAVAILPQILAFYFTPTAGVISDRLAAICLVTSQAGLLVFVVLNLGQPGIWLLGVGLVLNLLVIAANGGLMPISPEVAAQLLTNRLPETLETGARFGWSKDIVMARSSTQFWWLSDRFLLPPSFSFPGVLRLTPRYAYSFGDVLIALGAFWLLWAGGRSPARTAEISQKAGLHITHQGDAL